jgi:hypothetical protein
MDFGAAKKVKYRSIVINVVFLDLVWRSTDHEGHEEHEGKRVNRKERKEFRVQIYRATVLLLPGPGLRQARSFDCQVFSPFVSFVISFENTGRRGLGHLKQPPPRFVIPAWSAGIQANMDVSGGVLANWMPAIHAGMTKICIFMFCGRA